MPATAFSETRTHSTLPNAELNAARFGVPIAAGIGIAIGGFWLVAWFVGWGAKWSNSEFINPKTNLALGVLLAGSALLLLWPKNRGQLSYSAGTLLAAFVLLIGALTLGEHLLHFDLGIDQLLAKEAPGAAATTRPNRMGPPAATSLTLLGIGLLLLSRQRGRIAPYLGLIVFLISLVPAVGFLYGVSAFFDRPQTTGIAWPTVVALLSLGAALVLAHYDSEPCTA